MRKNAFQMLFARVRPLRHGSHALAQPLTFATHRIDPVLKTVTGSLRLDGTLVNVPQLQPDQVGLSGRQMLQIQVFQSSLLLVCQILRVLAKHMQGLFQGRSHLWIGRRFVSSHLVHRSTHQGRDVKRIKNDVCISELLLGPLLVSRAMDMSTAYQKGAKEELGDAHIVFDPFHVTALVSGAVDEVRRYEASANPQMRATLKQTLHVFRKNPENLTDQQQGRLEDLDLKHLATGQAYLIRLELRDIYQRTVKPERARYRLKNWINWVRGKCERLGECMAPMAKVANTVEKHLEGILAHWTNGCLSTGFLAGLNSGFSAVKRKARGYPSSEYMITMLYFVSGKLRLPSIFSPLK